MRGVNKVILIGHATRDAELRHTSTGKPLSSLRLATNRTVKGEEETQFHTIVCWDRLAETTATYVKKGDPLYVAGRLQYSSFPDEEGKARGVAEIVADDVQFLSRRGTTEVTTPDDVAARRNPSPLPDRQLPSPNSRRRRFSSPATARLSTAPTRNAATRRAGTSTWRPVRTDRTLPAWR